MDSEEDASRRTAFQAVRAIDAHRGRTDWKPVRLLVSVRNAAEAQAALAGGCNILDVKEPSRGALGMADVQAIASVIAAAAAAGGGPIPVSAALGEAADWLTRHDIPALPPGLAYAKLGPAGLGGHVGWTGRWRDVRTAFDRRTASPLRWIAVAYADWQVADAPPPEAILDAAASCEGFLLDTYVKDGRTLLDWLDPAELIRLRQRAAEHGLAFAVAGSLRADALPQIERVRPDIVAIRSAACRGGVRSAGVAANLVRQFKNRMEFAWQTAASCD